MTSRSPSASVSLDNAVGFLRCGGGFILEEWLALPGELQRMFCDAAEIVERRRAALVGMASQGEEGAARVFSDVDGGAWHTRCVLLSEAETALLEMRGRGGL